MSAGCSVIAVKPWKTTNTRHELKGDKIMQVVNVNNKVQYQIKLLIKRIKDNLKNTMKLVE